MKSQMLKRMTLKNTRKTTEIMNIRMQGINAKKKEMTIILITKKKNLNYLSKKDNKKSNSKSTKTIRYYMKKNAKKRSIYKKKIKSTISPSKDCKN